VEDAHLRHPRRCRACPRCRRPGPPPDSTLLQPFPVGAHRRPRVSQGGESAADRLVQAAWRGLRDLQALEGAA